MAQAQRDALHAEFLSSPEGRAQADGDEAYAVSLAIDCCCDYVDGRPLRWSPVVVELFMTSWVPRKVVTDPRLLEAIPRGLDAWIRFAGRKQGLPDWAIAETRAEIEGWRGEMMESANDPDTGGPGKQFLAAAEAAGIDLGNQDALDTFVAGWNARSSIP